MKRKRILYVQPNEKIGGSFQSLYYLLQNLDGTKYEATVLFPTKNEALIENLNNIGVKSIIWRFPSVGYAINSKYRLLACDFVKFFFLKNYYINRIPNLSVDLIHLNSVNSVFGLFMAKRLNVPLVWHMREQLPSLFGGLVHKYFISLCRDDVLKTIICISENESAGLPKEKVTVIHNFYKLEEQPLKSIRPLRFISIGSFTSDKGFWLLIKAVRYLRGKYSPNHFKICIMGISSRKTITKTLLHEKTEEHFKDEIAQHQIQDYFELYDQQHEIHPSFFSDFHVLIRPSIYEDPWGRDIIEAMSTGRAIIATGNYPKFVRDGFNGYLIKDSNPVTLARRMQHFIDDAQLVRTYGKNSFFLAKELFDPLENTKKVETIYDEVLASTSSGV